MKKLLALITALVMIFALAACGGNADDGDNQGEGAATEQTGGTFELALVTDIGTIDDGSFNQGSWEGLEQYALENNITHKYYMPAAQGDDSYLNAIDLAVQGGAKLIVTPGFLFETVIFTAQDIYPDVTFVLIDGNPHAGDYNYVVGPKTVGITYAEEQSGFLAGYAAVMDGYRDLGFLGGMAVPAVIRFGHGYVQGAEYAAQELGLEDGSINLNYFYTGVFEPSADIVTRAAAWYDGGTEVIFSCGGGILYSIIPEAEKAGAAVIGVDVDQSGESDTIITSAMKGLKQSVYDAIKAYYEGNFPGGQSLVLEAVNLGVGLPMATSKFTSFSQAQYDAIFAKIVEGEVVVDSDFSINADQIPTSAVVVSFYN